MFKVGQRVLCIIDNFDPDASPNPPAHKVLWPVKGYEYTVSWIRERHGWAWPNHCELGLVLEELPYHLGFDARAFTTAVSHDRKYR